MKLTNSLLAIALATSTLLTLNASAHEPKPQTDEMKGHDMSKMQGHDMSNMQGHDMKGHSAASMELHEIMMSGMKMPMKMTGNVDKDFASIMIMHHQMAVKMADLEIKNGKSSALRAMARKMKAAQQAEIKQLAAFAK